MVRPASSTRLLRSVLRPAHIRWLSCRTVRWDPSRCTVTIAPMDAQVSSETQAFLTRSLRGGLGDLILEL